MISLLIGLLPIILKLAGYIFNKIDATEEEKKKFLELATGAKDDALTPIQRKDEMAALKQKLKDRVSASKIT